MSQIDIARTTFAEDCHSHIPEWINFREVNRTLFEMVRHLKYHSDFAGIEAEDLDQLYEDFETWVELYACGFDAARLFDDFKYIWEVVHTPRGAAIQNAIEAASKDAPEIVTARYPQGSIRARVATICLAMQAINGGDSFPLSCRTLERILAAVGKPLSYQRCSSILRQMVRDGVLAIAADYHGQRDMATEYRVNLDALK